MAVNNNRLYYPLHYIAIGPYCTASGVPVHGVQSVGINTNFNLEQVLELGQASLYENSETTPSVDATIEKDLDGYPLIYHLATRSASSSTLIGRSNQRADVILSVFSDVQDNASGIPARQVYCSGMYVNSLNYKIPVQGAMTESVNLVGNDKILVSSTTIWGGGSGFKFNGHFTGNDAPASGIQRRQHVVMGLIAAGGSVWPTEIPGITTVTGSGYNVQSGSAFGAHIQDVAISTSLGREDIFELGSRRPYYKYAKFPAQVTCSITTLAAGSNPTDSINADSDSSSNTSNQPIVVKISDGTVFHLGTKNRLTSVSYGGGSTGGENVSLTYNYVNYNDLTISSPFDPG